MLNSLMFCYFNAFDFSLESEWEPCWVEFLVVGFSISSLWVYHILHLSYCWKNHLISLWRFPCILFVAIPLLLLKNIFLHILNFFQFIVCVSMCSPLDLLCLGLCALLGLDFFLSYIREVFILKYFLRPFLFSFWDPYKTNVASVECQILSQRSVRLSSFLFILFSLYCLAAVISSNLSSRSLICSSASVILQWIPSSAFFISVIVLLICSVSLLVIC